MQLRWLNYRGRETHVCVTKPSYHSIKECLFACSEPIFSIWPSRPGIIFNKIFIEMPTFSLKKKTDENVVCKIMAIFSGVIKEDTWRNCSIFSSVLPQYKSFSFGKLQGNCWPWETFTHIDTALCCLTFTLRWRHNGPDGVSNHLPHHCLLNRLSGRRTKKTSKLYVTGLCAGNSPGTGDSEFPA